MDSERKSQPTPEQLPYEGSSTPAAGEAAEPMAAGDAAVYDAEPGAESGAPADTAQPLSAEEAQVYQAAPSAPEGEPVVATERPGPSITPVATAAAAAEPQVVKPNWFQRQSDNVQAYVKANPRRSAIIGGTIVLFLIGLFIPVPEPHVSLAGEAIFSDGPSWLTNSVITTIIVDIIVIIMALAATARMKLVPTGWQNAMEAVVEYLYSLAESVAGRAARSYFPWVATIFFLVIISNWFGLVPGVGSIGYFHEDAGHAQSDTHTWQVSEKLVMADGKLLFQEQGGEAAAGEEAAAEGHAKFVPLFRAPSADLNFTFALAISTMVMVQIWGVRALGGGYFRKFFNASGQGFMRAINVFVGILELVSEFSRILAFGFRLFGNIFAGEIVLATMTFLIAFLIPIPFYFLEVFVGFVQALVFMMLALVFFSMATISHGGDHGHEGAH